MNNLAWVYQQQGNDAKAQALARQAYVLSPSPQTADTLGWILTTSGDVIHSFFIPALGVQRYAIPGRTIETWMRADTAGTFYGQCNQICGTNHSRMPIVVRAVPEQEFNAWLVQAKTKFASETPRTPDTTNEPRQQVASAGVQH